MSLGTMTRSLSKAAKAQFPGAADADIHRFVLLQVETALKHPERGIKDDKLTEFTDIAFGEAVEAGETWAVRLKNSYRDNVIKPLVDKAREKGVDPVPVIVMQTNLTGEQASEMVVELDASDADAGSSDAEFGLDGLGSDESDHSALPSAV